jgi:5,10-methylenetetrahydromethanopterin reductase
MVTAAAIASVEDLAPGRLVVAFGTGFTARIMLGQKPMRWADLARYLGQVRGLLAGDVVDIDGQACQMLQPEGFGPARPLATPLWAAPMGPKGFATAREIGVDGVMLTGLPPSGGGDWKDSAVIVSGTVVRPGEDHTSERLLAAAGPWFAVSFHGMWEYAPEALDVMAGGPEWRDAMLAARPERQRHLAVHEGHVVAPPARDVAAIRAAGPAIMESGWTGDAARVAERFAEVADAGVAEVVYCAAGPDIAGELEAFAAAVR